jgi:hypothetical protein
MKTNKSETIYVLKGDAKPMSFILASRDTTRTRLITQDETGKYRAIRYARNHESPFVDEQDGEIILEPIEFKDGVLIVQDFEVGLKRFMDAHPANGEKFIELNHEKIAEEEIDWLKVATDALVKTRDSDINVLESVARVLIGNKVDNMTSNEIRRDMMKYAQRDPMSVLDLFDDPSLEKQNLARRAISAGWLSLRNGGKEIYNNFPENRKRLMVVPMDMDAYTALESYLESNEGKDLYVQLTKVLE